MDRLYRVRRCLSAAGVMGATALVAGCGATSDGNGNSSSPSARSSASTTTTSPSRSPDGDTLPPVSPQFPSTPPHPTNPTRPTEIRPPAPTPVPGWATSPLAPVLL